MKLDSKLDNDKTNPITPNWCICGACVGCKGDCTNLCTGCLSISVSGS
jgi:hypothetical protein